MTENGEKRTNIFRYVNILASKKVSFGKRGAQNPGGRRPSKKEKGYLPEENNYDREAHNN
jgi:hypothetical protein